MSTLAMPSPIAWWVLMIIATSSSARPSTIHNSHKGRVRSSGSDCNRPISVAS